MKFEDQSLVLFSKLKDMKKQYEYKNDITRRLDAPPVSLSIGRRERLIKGHFVTVSRWEDGIQINVIFDLIKILSGNQFMDGVILEEVSKVEYARAFEKARMFYQGNTFFVMWHY